MTQLESLQKYDGVTASRILSGLVLAEGNNPGVGEAASFQHYVVEGKEILEELRRRLNLNASNDAGARALLLEALAEQIVRISMAGKDIGEVLERAGNNGVLSPSHYRVVFGQNFNICAALGTKVAHVVDGIARPDDVQHFTGRNGEKPFSLFLKFQPGSTPGRSFWLMVYAHRTGTTLLVQNAWRVYVDDVDLTEAQRPVHVLRAFVQKFGLEIQIGSETGSFFVDKDLPMKPGEVIEAYVVKGVRNRHFMSTISGLNLPGVHHVVLAYAIDVDRYAKFVEQKGVRVKLPPLPPAAGKNDEVRMMVSDHDGRAVYNAVLPNR